MTRLIFAIVCLITIPCCASERQFIYDVPLIPVAENISIKEVTDDYIKFVWPSEDARQIFWDVLLDVSWPKTINTKKRSKWVVDYFEEAISEEPDAPIARIFFDVCSEETARRLFEHGIILELP